MSKKIAFFHSTFNTPAVMREAFEQRFPGIPLINIVDDSILPEVIGNGSRYTPGIVRRLVAFAVNAQMQGAVAAVCMCTTLTGAVSEASKTVDIPFVTIDGPMLEQASMAGDKLAVLVTAPTTIEATTQAARSAAARQNRGGVKIDVILVKGAFEALNVEKDPDKHDRLIEETARRAAEEYDVIVMAQITMVRAASRLSDLSVPVLTSIQSGVEQLAPWLE